MKDPLLRQVTELERGVSKREHRGLKAAALGRYAVAAAELREVVALDGDRIEARHNLALALIHLRQEAEAEAHLDEILARSPSHAPTLVLLGNLRRQQGRLDDAERHLRAAVEVDPGSARSHLALADLLQASGRRSEAERSLETARSLDPTVATSTRDLDP